MMYLISQLWVWMVLALILGLIVGWLTCARAPTRWWSGWIPWGTAAFLVGLAVAILKLLPNRAGYLLDTALLLFGFYIVGCCIGCLIKQWLAGGEAVAAAAPVVAAASAGAGAPVAAAKPVAAAAPVATPAPRPVPAAVEPAPAEPDYGPEPQVDVPAGLPGKRPRGYAAPIGGKEDDLKRIRGIGRQNEGRLHALGIWHFSQVAAWVRDEIDWVGGYLAFPGRIDREDWVGQAKVLASGAETEFSRRVDKGEVATSKDSGNKGADNVADLSAIPNAAPRPKS